MKRRKLMCVVFSIDLILRMTEMPDEKKIALIQDEIESLKSVSGGFWRWKPQRRNNK